MGLVPTLLIGIDCSLYFFSCYWFCCMFVPVILNVFCGFVYPFPFGVFEFLDVPLSSPGLVMVAYCLFYFYGISYYVFFRSLDN